MFYIFSRSLLLHQIERQLGNIIAGEPDGIPHLIVPGSV